MKQQLTALFTLLGASLSYGADATARVVEETSVIVNPIMKTVVVYDRETLRYVDFATEQFCMSRNHAGSTPTCRDFSSLSARQTKYKDDVAKLLDLKSQPTLNGMKPTVTEKVEYIVNSANATVMEVDSSFGRVTDFETEQLCITRAFRDSGMVCKDFTVLNDAQRAYVGGMQQKFDKLRQTRRN